MKHKLKIADFSEYPGGRYRKYSVDSGEEFREDYLIPALEKHDLVEIDISQVYTYAPGFVDEITAGVIREGHLTHKEFCRRISFVSDKPNEFFIKDMFEAFRDEQDPVFLKEQEDFQDQRDEELVESVMENV